MMEFLITSPAILIISLIAVIMSLSARFVSNKYVYSGLYILSFMCVVSCTIYALLLGAQLIEVLAYLLIFTLLGLTSFFPTSNEKTRISKTLQKKKDTDINSEANEKEQAEGKSDEL